MNAKKTRLDQYLAEQKLAPTRSQAESLIRLGKVKMNNKIVQKPGQPVSVSDKIFVENTENYVSRAGLKLASVSDKLRLNFENKIVLDVGSSTGGFTDYALKHAAVKVYAVDAGTDQLHPMLHGDKRIELHEQTDIRNFIPSETPDIAVIDVSFISLREILPTVARIADKNTQVVAMCKPQFEAGDSLKHKGVIKNDTIRRKILKDFELWTSRLFKIVDKADSEVAGAKGNVERFYLLKLQNK